MHCVCVCCVHCVLATWGSKVSTINDGASVVPLPCGFKRTVLHGEEFRCIQLSLSQGMMLGGEPNMLNKWKQDHNLDDIEVRKVLDLTLLVSVIYGERRDVDMAGTTLYKELKERKAMNKPAEKVDTAAEEDG